ncbi:MAG: hypothetical protein HOV83_06685 [Catenulispora sp.]|nr:hypothetical protein [Catenulispora sp.]
MSGAMGEAQSLEAFVGSVLCFVFVAAGLVGIIYKAIATFRPQQPYRGPLYPTDLDPGRIPTAPPIVPVYQPPPDPLPPDQFLPPESSRSGWVPPTG